MDIPAAPASRDGFNAVPMSEYSHITNFQASANVRNLPSGQEAPYPHTANMDRKVFQDKNYGPNHVRAWRKVRGLTAEVVAEMVGASKGNYSDLENGTDKFTAWVHGYVHALAPHSSLSLYLVSLGFICLSLLGVSVLRALEGNFHPMPHGQRTRIAFAAGPIPVYFLLPLAPFDADLGRVLLEERLVLALAGAYGISWTLRDLRGMARQRRHD